MIDSVVRERLKEALSSYLRKNIISISERPVAGGCINHGCQLLVNQDEKFFCKINTTKNFPLLFEKERNGLEYLFAKNVIRVPRVVAIFLVNDLQILVLEWIEQGNKTANFWKTFGEKLATLHAITSNFFGFSEDNFMGSLVQHNKQSTQWVEFFIRQRLVPQIDLAVRNGLLAPQHVSQFERLYIGLPEIFPEHRPALVHGDLWSGNYLCDAKNEPVLIDPAIYYGHPAVDMGMTTLFGGFHTEFYDAYAYHYPFPDNFKLQWQICNLYPLLIHLNLFGKGYLPDILRIIRPY